MRSNGLFLAVIVKLNATFDTLHNGKKRLQDYARRLFF
jgi:phosphopantetheine adenylyltransferase